MKNHLALAVALTLVASSAAPPSAKADIGDGIHGAALLVAGVGVAFVGVTALDIALIVEGIDKFASSGHGLYEAGAWTEVVLGSLHLIAGTIVLGAGASDRYKQMGVYWGGAAPPLVLGSYLLVHGIWSLTNPRSNGPPVNLGIAPHVSDSRGISGLVASVSGTF